VADFLQRVVDVPGFKMILHWFEGSSKGSTGQEAQEGHRRTIMNSKLGVQILSPRLTAMASNLPLLFSYMTS